MAKLSTQIQSLIAYANETTGNADTQLGDAIKALADGYKGGGANVPLPDVSDADLLGSQLASLITYANSITSKADTTIGDAVRSLVEGYGGGGRLPSEYQEVEYLKGTGTQWISTGVKANNNTSLDIKFYISVSAVDCGICGARDSATENNFGVSVNAASVYADFGNYQLNRINTDNRIKETYEVHIGNDYLLVNEKRTDVKNVTFSSSRIVTLFRFENGAQPLPLNGIVYYCIFKENGVETRNLVPCYRKSDNVAGMYDLVSGTFFTNAGTGSFEVGADV